MSPLFDILHFRDYHFALSMPPLPPYAAASVYFVRCCRHVATLRYMRCRAMATLMLV